MQYRDLEADIDVDPASSPEFVDGIKYTLDRLDTNRPWGISESSLEAALAVQDARRVGTPHSYVRGVLDTLDIPVNEESMELPSRAGAKFLAYPRGNTRHQGERTLVIAGKQCIDIDSGERHSPDLFSGNYPAWIVTAVIDWG